MDCPEPRPIQSLEQGTVVEVAAECIGITSAGPPDASPSYVSSQPRRITLPTAELCPGLREAYEPRRDTQAVHRQSRSIRLATYSMIAAFCPRTC